MLSYCVIGETTLKIRWSASNNTSPPTGKTVLGQLCPKSFIFRMGNSKSFVTSSRISSMCGLGVSVRCMLSI